jgi:hypothetical protein
MLTVALIYCYAECRYAGFHNANVVILNAIMLNVVMLSVMAQLSLAKMEKSYQELVNYFICPENLSCLTFVDNVINIWLKRSTLLDVTFSTKHFNSVKLLLTYLKTI